MAGDGNGEGRLPWPHAPEHRLSESGTFIVTAGTYRKDHHWGGGSRLRVLHGGLLKYAANYGWRLEAWAVFSNNYHFVAHSPDGTDGATNLSRFLGHFHSRSCAWLNRQDDTPGRKVWHNFRETRLTNETSYFARLHYVHQNAVKHGLVALATDYPWCSAGWFERTANPVQVRTIYGFKTDRVKVSDDFDPIWDRE